MVYSFLRSVGAQASKLGVQFTVYSLQFTVYSQENIISYL